MGGSTADIVARLKLNATNFTAELQRELGTAETKFGQTGNVIGRNLAQGIGGGLQEATSRVPVLGSALAGLSGPALIATAGVGAIAAGIAEGIRKVEEMQKAVRVLNATLEGGNRTGFTETALIGFSEEMANRFAITREQILKTEEVLATFDNISGKTFKDTLVAAADLAAFFGEDMSAEAEKLGTVLQNLGDGKVEGLKKGFKFLGTETLATIENLAKTGHTAEAQAKLLAVLEQRLGPVGEQNAKGVSGALFHMKEALVETSREMFERTGTYDAFVKVLDHIAASAQEAGERLKGMNQSEAIGQVADWAARYNPSVLPATMAGNVLFGSGAGRPGSNWEMASNPAALPVTIAGNILSGAGGGKLRSSGGSGDPFGFSAMVQQLRDASAQAEAAVLQAAHKKEVEANEAAQLIAEHKVNLLAPVSGPVTSGFGFRAQPTAGASTYHPAIDFGVPVGTPVRAGADGVVVRTGSAGGLGQVVWIDYGNKTIAEFGHLSDILVKPGDAVRAGEVVARSGNTGISAGPHLDYRLKVGGAYVNPLTAGPVTVGGGVGAAMGDFQTEQERKAKEAAARAEQERKAQQAILDTMHRQLDAAQQEAQVDAKRSILSARMAQEDEDVARLRASRAADLDKLGKGEKVVSEQVQDQLGGYYAQAAALGGLIRSHGARATLTAQEKQEEAAAAQAMQDELDKAIALGKTGGDILAIEVAILRVKHQLANATEDGAKAEADAKAAAEARKEFEKGLEQQRVEQARQQYEDLANFFYDAFNSGGKSIWKDFEDEGMHVLAKIAAQWTLSLLSGQKASMPGILSQLGATSGAGGATGALGALTASLGQAVPELAIGMAITSTVSNLLGIKNHAGGIFGIGGNLLINALGGNKPKQAAATLSVDPYGNFVTGAAKGNDATSRSNATAEAGSLGQTLKNIADSLGGSVTSVGGISLGYRASDKKQPFRIDPTGQGRATGNGVLAFATEEEQIQKAVELMLQRGVIDGISAASKKILSAGGDLQAALEKASLIEAIPKALAAHLDPVGAAVDALNQKWAKAIAALKEGGATTEQMADAQKEYGFELADVKASTAEASAGLKDFLDSLNFGSSSPYSLRDQEAQAKAALQPYLDHIGAGDAIDQAKYQSAAQSFLDIERQLYGSTSQFFDAMDMVQAATGKAISAIDNAKPIRTYADPFAEATAGNTQTTNEILAQQLPSLGAKLDSLLSALNSGDSGGFIGGALGFARVASA